MEGDGARQEAKLSRWVRTDLPERVHWLTHRHRAILVGSQARRYANGLKPDPKKDWDLFVPYSAWREAALSIPKDARPNGNRGWRFESDGASIDVWPDDLWRFFEEATSLRGKSGPQFAVDLSAGIIFKAEHVAYAPAEHAVAGELNIEHEMREMACDCAVAPMHVLLAAWRAFQKLDMDTQVFAIEDACQEVYDLVQGRTR